jgi:predicted  nucleic acid-binding Zn-ribbon protein
MNARAEAENALARASAEVDERLRSLQEELAALREEAETRMREIQADTEAVWKERRELLDEIRTIASGLAELANTAAARQPPEPEEETLKAEVGD